ncbi:F510_1955 family glycosylhydrolase [Jeotgalibacillus soli]|nr:hypothetical protein [Jeotgalibacillus soli]
MKWKPVLALITGALLLGACAAKEEETNYFTENDEVHIEHVHGMGFIGDDLLLATHDGLVKFSDNQWYETTRNKHDYMGFTAIEGGFYASGHPEPGSDIENPLGLVKSTDLGESMEQLAFYGETDFHYLAASAKGKVIYGVLSEANSELTPGVYYTDNEGNSWNELPLNGLAATSLRAIAAHPTEPNVVALVSPEGLFLSEDYGSNFTQISDEEGITSLHFTEDALLFSLVKEEGVTFQEFDLASASQQELSSIALDEDAVSYISANPANLEEVWAITFEHVLLKSKDGGRTWEHMSH